MGGTRVQSKNRVSLDDLLKEVEKLTSSGFTHLVAITAVDRGDKIEVIYHFSSLNGSIVHLSVEVSKQAPVVPTLTSIVPGAAYYERETEELFGLKVEGLHNTSQRRFILPDCYPQDAPPPLLKEVKSESIKEKIAKTQSCGPVQFTPLAPLSPENVVLPLGPYHPALKEPERFSLIVEGETIRKAYLRIGFVHRGIEKAAEGRTYLRDIFLLERVCGICSTHHAWTFVEAVEKLLSIDIPKRALYLRTLIAELERIHSHSLWLGLVGYWMGFETMFMWVWSLRETILDLLEEATGNRVHKSFVTIGGVRKDIDDAKLKKMSLKVGEFSKQIENVIETAMSSDLFVERTRNIGVYTLDQARKYVTVGPVRRAAGDPYDIRKIEPYGAYGDLEFETITSDRGDVYSLVLCRLKELSASVHDLSSLLSIYSGFTLGSSKALPVRRCRSTTRL
ncbi:MAG: NADH-quinone oxidoreductase subunit C [Infirmifilum sp.]